MTKLMMGFAIALAAAACGGKSKGNEALAKTEELSRRMCECKDKACADKVNEDFTKWGQEMAKSASGKTDEKPDAELSKKLTEASTRYSECYTKLATATPPPAETKAEDKQPEETKAEDKQPDEPKQDAPKQEPAK